jgi:hypothetical protein
MNEISPSRRRRKKPETGLGPPDTPPHVAVALNLLDKKHVVTREPGESDERYRSRCDLLSAVLELAKRRD